MGQCSSVCAPVKKKDNPGSFRSLDVIIGFGKTLSTSMMRAFTQKCTETSKKHVAHDHGVCWFLVSVFIFCNK